MKVVGIVVLVMSCSLCGASDLKITASDGFCCSLPIEYPTNYYTNTCKYNMDLVTDVLMNTVVNVDFVYDAASCSARTQYIGFDGNYYLFNTESYLDFSGVADLLWIKQDYSNCHTVSGAGIQGSGAQLVLLGNSLLFDLQPGTVKMNYYESDNVFVLSFNSVNGDIICDNPVDLSGIITTGGSVIFSDGFE